MQGVKSPEKSKKKWVIPPGWKKRFPSESSLGLFILILVLLLVLVWYFFAKKHNPNPVKPIPIVSGVVTTRDVPIYISALGTVTPVYTVTVQSQINGLLMQVLFKEGDLVKKGQLIAQIDQRPYEALLTQYQGDLKRDTALLENARIDLKRYQTLWKENSISQQTLATQQALVKQYEGNVETDLGLIQSTKINLIYCNITSPIDGRVGLRLIDPGNFVQTSTTSGIAVITTHDPITVIFPIAEDFVPQVAPQAFKGKNLEVKVYNRQQNKLLATGKLIALNNQIDPATGTVKLRAIFDNKESKLFPNQFVNVQILVNTLTKATLVPTSAIQHTTSEDFVYIVNADHTVTTTPVVMGPASGDDTVISQGLAPGQHVVIEGADKLMNGSKIIVQEHHSSKKTKPHSVS
ncbi:efflux RND transporter periplasmic adaptor subunit [Legionella saoudiensis]|uniref:efflux RND transporter periplasmic adaptor subunit n=1 Tax=Legionella saoudiensis TaxID=1750561 RepID=UPI000730E2C2|nr:efflux RND transporter periplasmic adaptor subunit [Legionella saoudiensis]